MNHRGIARVKPAILDHRVRSVLIIIVARHDYIAPHSDFAQRFSILGYFFVVFVHHPKLARTHQFDALARLDFGAFLERQI